MNILNIKNELSEQLLAACQQSLQKIVEDFTSSLSKDRIYAFVLYPSSGFVDFGLAYSTRESLAKINEKMSSFIKDNSDLLIDNKGSIIPDDYCELTACEWDYIWPHFECFENINDFLDENFDLFYEAEMEPDEINLLFKGIVINVFFELLKRKSFDAHCFENDLLLGVQFPDGNNTDLIKSISKEVNSEYWHQKFIKVVESD
ncbi:hypothetical protein [uncultured Shewanella sp.]|uniref:hypothetical protein n=1 Tax=uncultured Shewanella sp. TaxID=173975 RepID=UPI00262B8BBB|nr:hypothetical protein [uncultured Shewanella sp.]